MVLRQITSIYFVTRFNRYMFI